METGGNDMKVPNHTYLNRLQQWRNTVQQINIIAEIGKKADPITALNAITEKCLASIHATDMLIRALEDKE